MIEEVVPPLTQRSLASRAVVEKSIVDHERPVADIFGTAIDQLVSRHGTALTFRLPESMVEELRWVADQEGCEISDIVVNAVDEFLADHWVRNSDDF